MKKLLVLERNLLSSKLKKKKIKLRRKVSIRNHNLNFRISRMM